VTEAVEHLLCKCEAPSPINKRKQKTPANIAFIDNLFEALSSKKEQVKNTLYY
jgi:hypothetical protein